MRGAYPIVLSHADEGGYVVYVPDFRINTEGEDVSDAMLMARDAIGLVGIDMQDAGEDIPEPSSLDAIKSIEGDIYTLVDVDFDDYRKKHDNRAVKKNCTIPSWLNEEAIAKGINFSQVLQDGLKEIIAKGN